MQQGEPSLEEILASIKKVMARDDAGTAGQDGPGRPQEPAAHHANGSAVEPADQDEADDILDLEAHMLIADTPDAGQPDWTEAGLSFIAADPPAVSGESHRQNAASAVRESLAALERLTRTDSQPQPDPSLDPTLEPLAREMLRPMLAEWLEAHLPRIVERLVRAEIARIVDRRG